MSKPLVSCVLVTKDRRLFARQALTYILAQKYENLEIIVVDSGKKPLLVGLDNEWAYPDNTDYGVPIYNCRRHRELTVGTSRNIGTEIARGEIIAHFDDDDFYGPERIGVQVEKLLAGADICTTDRCYELDLTTRLAYPHNSMTNPRFFSGGTIAYWRKAWEKSKFRDITQGEDGTFYHDAEQAGLRIVPWERLDFYCYVRHRSNGSLGEHRKSPTDATDQVKKMIGSYWPFYEDMADLAPTRNHNVPPNPAELYRQPYRAGHMALGIVNRGR